MNMWIRAAAGLLSIAVLISSGTCSRDDVPPDNAPPCDGDYGETHSTATQLCPETMPLCGNMVLYRIPDGHCHACDGDFVSQGSVPFWCPKRTPTCVFSGPSAGSCISLAP